MRDMQWMLMVAGVAFLLGIVAICLHTEKKVMPSETLQLLADTASYEASPPALTEDKRPDRAMEGKGEPIIILTEWREFPVRGIEPLPLYGDIFVFEGNESFGVVFSDECIVQLGEGFTDLTRNPIIYHRINGTWKEKRG